MALLLVAGLLLFAPNLLMQVLPGLAAALICPVLNLTSDETHLPRHQVWH